MTPPALDDDLGRVKDFAIEQFIAQAGVDGEDGPPAERNRMIVPL